MNEKNKPNTGALFQNDRKEKETHPDLKGTLDVEGQKYWLSAWRNVSKAGNKYWSVSIQKKENIEEQYARTINQPAPQQEADSQDLPF